jgi:hypothetical protein
MKSTKKVSLVIALVAAILFSVTILFAVHLKKDLQNVTNIDDLHSNKILFVTISIWCLSLIPIFLYFYAKKHIIKEEISNKHKAYLIVFAIVAIVQTLLLNLNSIQNQIDTAIGLCVVTFVSHCFLLWYVSIEFVTQKQTDIIPKENLNSNKPYELDVYESYDPNKPYKIDLYEDYKQNPPSNTNEASAPTLDLL